MIKIESKTDGGLCFILLLFVLSGTMHINRCNADVKTSNSLKTEWWEGKERRGKQKGNKKKEKKKRKKNPKIKGQMSSSRSTQKTKMAADITWQNATCKTNKHTAGIIYINSVDRRQRRKKDLYTQTHTNGE